MTEVTPPRYGSAAIPEAKHVIEPTSQSTIDEALAILQDYKKEWAELDIYDRIELLKQVRDGMVDVAERWVETAVDAKGFVHDYAGRAEEWSGGITIVVRNLSLLIESLRDIAKYGAPQLPDEPYERPDGQVVAPVFPATGWDKVLFRGITAEVWMEPDVTLRDLPKTQASFYRDPSHQGRVSLVLGAGNVAAIGPTDTLYKMVVEGMVVILKMNPVNEYLGPFIDEAFAPLRDRGFFRLVYGGAAEGEYLCQHPAVEEMHVTGSDKTHDAIVFGVGDEGSRRKADRDPRNTKRMTSELGNVSPLIVVPGPWSKADLEFQAKNIGASLVNNAGFNCAATRVIIQHEQWNQRERLLDAIKTVLREAPDRKPYYPGAEARHRTFLDAHPEANQLGETGSGKVPWTLIDHLDPSRTDDICFTTESWCGITSEVALPAASVVEYIDKAVEFANDRCWGTLSGSIFVHPESLKDPAVADAVERAIAKMRFGAVAVNHWPALSYFLCTTTWGAFPGHPIDNICSGQGVAHNTYMFERAQKSVLRGPFRMFPKPSWFLDNKTSAEVGRKLAYFTADPSIARLPSLFWSALRG